jgi:hypothetical protein
VEKDGKIINRIQYSKLERSGTPKGPRLSVVSLIHEDSLPIQINGSPVSLPPLRAQHFDRTLNESITITHGGAPVMEPVEIAAEIPYLVFLFKNQSTGKVEGALAREMNVVLELPRSMQEQKEKEQAAKAEAESKDSPAKKPKPQP